MTNIAIEVLWVSNANPHLFRLYSLNDPSILYLATVLMEAGYVLDRKNFSRICLDLGMNDNTFDVYLSYSPIGTWSVIFARNYIGVPNNTQYTIKILAYYFVI